MARFYKRKGKVYNKIRLLLEVAYGPTNNNSTKTNASREQLGLTAKVTLSAAFRGHLYHSLVYMDGETW